MKALEQLEQLKAACDKVRPAGDGGYTSCCPAHQDKDPSLTFMVKQGKLLAHCFAGCSFEDIMESVGIGREVNVKTFEPKSFDKFQKNRKAFNKIFISSKPGWMGKGLGLYLESRGLPECLLDRLHKDIMVSPDIPYWDTSGDDPVEVGRFPAMVCVVRSWTGVVICAHRTYLNPETYAKASLDPVKKMTGRMWPGNDPGMIRISQNCGGKRNSNIALCEGVETGMAWLADNPDHEVYSCVSANWLEKALPETNEAATIWIIADNDKSGTGQKAANRAAERLSMTRRVKVVMPELVGDDYLDLYNRRMK